MESGVISLQQNFAVFSPHNFNTRVSNSGVAGPELSVYLTEFEKDPPPQKKCTKIEGGWRCHLRGGGEKWGV